MCVFARRDGAMIHPSRAPIDANSALRCVKIACITVCIWLPFRLWRVESLILMGTSGSYGRIEGRPQNSKASQLLPLSSPGRRLFRPRGGCLSQLRECLAKVSECTEGARLVRWHSQRVLQHHAVLQPPRPRVKSYPRELAGRFEMVFAKTIG